MNEISCELQRLLTDKVSSKSSRQAISAAKKIQIAVEKQKILEALPCVGSGKHGKPSLKNKEIRDRTGIQKEEIITRRLQSLREKKLVTQTTRGKWKKTKSACKPHSCSY